MNDPARILNPLENPILVPVLWRVALVFLIGLLLVWALHGFRLQKLTSSEVGKRYLSWLVIGPAYMLIILFGGDFSLVALGVLMFIAIYELWRITNLPPPYIYAFIFLSLVTVFTVSYATEYFYTLPLLYFFVVTLTAIRCNDAKKGFVQASTALFICIWIFFSLAHFVLLGHLNNELDLTKSLLLLVGFAVALSDIGAYIVGNLFSKNTLLQKLKIADKISPRKTYPGVLGNILGAGLGIWVMYFAVHSYLEPVQWVILAILIGCMSVVGDMTESLFKRFYGVKDSGKLIPGHGGILDRIDSILRVIVVVYYYLLFVLFL